MSTDPYAPPALPNPVAPGATDFGVKAGASVYTPDGGGGISLFTSGAGKTTLVLEVGVGRGASVTEAAGPGVAPPSGPQVQLSGSVNQDGQVTGSAGVSLPLTGGAPSVNGAVNGPAGTAGTVSWNPDTGWQVGGQVSQKLPIDVGEGIQGKMDLAVPIPLPDTTQTSAPDANGVSTQIALDAGGNAQVTAVRNVAGFGYPDGNGNTVTVNPDLSITTHTPTSDVTTYPPNYQGPQQYIGGTLTNVLISDQPGGTNAWSWQPPDGGPTITQTEAGTRTVNVDGTVYQESASGARTQTNPDGSSVSWDPSNTTTSTDGQGTTTYFQPDGTIMQQNGPTQFMWDASGNGYVVDGVGGLVSIGDSVPAPAPPPVPPSVPAVSDLVQAPPPDTFTPYITALPGSSSAA
ncbi:MAG: hypothetical protein JOY78_17245, partial [Pseudonocardia sp.]|nr:hypothetical protein [Pseudonocardia sp.]